MIMDNNEKNKKIDQINFEKLEANKVSELYSNFV